MKITKDNIIIIVDKENSIKIPIDKIECLESRICSTNISLTKFGYWITVSHELKIFTNSGDIYSFVYPIPWHSYFKSNYDEVFQLIDMNIPNYKCILIGEIQHINKDIEYYIKNKKRLSFLRRNYLFFIDLPTPMKFLYVLTILTLFLGFAFICFVLLVCK